MLNNSYFKTIIAGSTASLVLSSFIIGLRYQGNFEQIELFAYDFLVRLDAKPSFDERITIVGIDDNSLQKLQSDKISDRTLKQVLETIEQYQPRVIGVDIIRDVPIGEGRAELLNYINNLYQPLGGTIKPIIFACALPSGKKPNGIAPPNVIDPDSSVGFVDLETDPQNIFGGEIIRRAPISSIPVNLGLAAAPESQPETQFEAETTNSLCTAPFSFSFLTSLSYIQALQIENLLPDATPDISEFLDLNKITEGEIGFKSLTFRPLKPRTGSYHNLEPGFYQHLIDYNYTQPGEIISLTQVLDDQVPPQKFKDKIVLIGYTTKEDIHQTPLGLSRGIFVHGWIISQLLSNVLDEQPPIWTWSEPVEWLWILGWGIVGSIVALRIRPALLFFGSQGIAIAILWGSCWFLFTQQGWIPLIPPFLSFAIASIIMRAISAKLEKDQILQFPPSPRPGIIDEIVLDGRYKIIGFLGKGGFGKIYLAEDTKRPHNPHCVVKQLHLEIEDPEFWEIARRLFNQEAETLEKLGFHDQIPRLLANFEQDKEFYLVEEYIEGQTLSQELLPNQPWSEVKVIDLLRDCLEIIDFVHSNQVIHRDIKPDNLIRRYQDHKMVLVDFGSVKEVIMSQTQTISSTVAVGTRGYMPTEQARGKPRFTSDIYALGVIAIQALTGIDPIHLQEDENGEIIWQSQAECSPQLKEILTKMTRYHFKERYQSASEILEALNSLYHEFPGSSQESGEDDNSSDESLGSTFIISDSTRVQEPGEDNSSNDESAGDLDSTFIVNDTINSQSHRPAKRRKRFDPND